MNNPTRTNLFSVVVPLLSAATTFCQTTKEACETTSGQDRPAGAQTEIGDGHRPPLQTLDPRAEEGLGVRVEGREVFDAGWQRRMWERAGHL